MRIELPLETWVEILDWLKRKEFAAKLDQLWDREFTPIAQEWLHKYQRNVQIGKLWIKQGEDGRAELRDDQNRILPIAQVDMPDNIRGFSKIVFYSFLDSAMLEFLARMRRIFHNISLRFISNHGTEDEIKTAVARAALSLDRLQPMISGPIEWMNIEQAWIPIFTDSFPALLLNTKLLYILKLSGFQTVEQTVKWLFTPRGDGQPRVLIIDDNERFSNFLYYLDVVQQRFVDPERVKPSPFFIRSLIAEVPTPRDLVESATKHGPTEEQLTVKKTDLNQYGYFYVLISNCALDDDQKELNEKKVLDYNLDRETQKPSTFVFA